MARWTEIEQEAPELAARVRSFPEAWVHKMIFRAELEEASVVRLNEARDRLVIDSWRPGRGLRSIERK